MRIVVAARADSLTGALAARLTALPGAEVRRVEPPAAGEATAEAWAARLAGPAPDVVVYRPRRLRGARSGRPDLASAAAFLAALAALPPGRLVLLSSAAVVAPEHRHPGHVAETRPPPAAATNRVSRAWIELEELAEARLGEAGVGLVVLRPVAVAARDGEDLLARLARRRLAVRVAGHDPAVQALAPEDLAEAVAAAVERGGAGAAYQVAPPGAVPVRVGLRLAGAKRLPLPWNPQRAARALLSRANLAAPAEEAAWVRFPATVSAARIERELGFTARRSSAAALGALGGERGEAAARALPEPDPYGMDRAYVDRLGRTLFRFLHRVYWRIEVAGIEHLPRAGGAVLAGMHRGFMPWDGVMTLHTVARAIGRYPRFLIHPCLVKLPFLSDYMTRLGGIIACQENADWVLGQGELLGMYPEGISGAFTPYRRAYQLGRFGRDEFVKMALRHGAPIVPFVTVGSAEIFPILGRVDWRWVKRWTEWPYLPITPTFPLLPVPLPSKWHVRFLAPIEVGRRFPPEAAGDPEVVAQVSAEVRSRMEEAIDQMLARRRHVFWGSVFGPEEEAAPPGATAREKEAG